MGKSAEALMTAGRTTSKRQPFRDSGKGKSPAQTDRDWFEKHKKRSHRIRPVLPGELEQLDRFPAEHMSVLRGLAREGKLNFCVVVRQLEPGVRMRVLSGWKSPNVPDDEYFAHALFDFILESEQLPPGETVVFDQAFIEERARSYRQATRQ
jgi:hypothetical protein